MKTKATTATRRTTTRETISARRMRPGLAEAIRLYHRPCRALPSNAPRLPTVRAAHLRPLRREAQHRSASRRWRRAEQRAEQSRVGLPELQHDRWRSDEASRTRTAHSPIQSEHPGCAHAQSMGDSSAEHERAVERDGASRSRRNDSRDAAGATVRVREGNLAHPARAWHGSPDVGRGKSECPLCRSGCHAVLRCMSRHLSCLSNLSPCE